MRKLELAGKRFGKLTAVSPMRKSESTLTHQVKRGVVWVCVCDCGNTKQVNAQDLSVGHIRSCGCLQNMTGDQNPLWAGHGKISMKFFGDLKRGAEKRGIRFAVTIEELWSLFENQDGKCALSGLPLTFSGGVMARGPERGSASVDRVASELGYVPTNVQWVHKKINVMKNRWSQDEFVDLCHRVARHHSPQRYMTPWAANPTSARTLF